MSAESKFAWLLRQETGSLAEQCLMQTFLIACQPKPTKLADGREFPPFHVWLSPAQIAQRTGMHERTIPGVVRSLQRRGLIELAGRYGKTGQIKVYRVLIEETERPKEPSLFTDTERPKEPSLFGDERPKVPALKDRRKLQQRPKDPASAYIDLSQQVNQQDKREREQRSAPKRRIPEDWKPSDKLMAWAKAERPDLDIPRVAESFRDYHLGKGESRASWDASFRTWVRKEHRAGKHGAQSATRPNSFEELDYGGQP